MYSPWVAFCAGPLFAPFLRGVGGHRRSFTARRSHESKRLRPWQAVVWPAAAVSGPRRGQAPQD
eukprot:4005616-Prymnesium_polylepis.1